MKTFTFANNQERDRYLDQTYRDRRDTVTPYAFDVEGGTISVFERTLIFEPASGQPDPRHLPSTGPHEQTRPVPVWHASGPASGEAGAFEVLRRDHHRLEALLDKLAAREASRESEGIRGLFDALKEELSVHAKVEDLHVYRVFQQAESTQEAARRALAAHAEIQEILDRLSGERDTARWSNDLRRLRETLQRHIAEEERDLFDRVGGVMTREEAHELKLQVEAARRQITGQDAQPAGGIPRG